MAEMQYSGASDTKNITKFSEIQKSPLLLAEKQFNSTSQASSNIQMEQNVKVKILMQRNPLQEKTSTPVMNLT